MIFIDTNYFLRFLIKDIENQHNTAKNLFLEAASGKIKLITSVIVFFEIYWVLSSYYEKEKAELIPTIRKVLNLNFIQLEERDLLEEALNLFENNNLSFEDCYNLSFAKYQKAKSFKTFDKKLEKAFNKQFK